MNMFADFTTVSSHSRNFQAKQIATRVSHSTKNVHVIDPGQNFMHLGGKGCGTSVVSDIHQMEKELVDHLTSVHIEDQG